MTTINHQSCKHHEKDNNDLSFTEINRRHWNDFVSHYTEHQWQRDLINNTTTLIRSNVDWFGVKFNDLQSPASLPRVRVLDYACGPGTITNALDNHATEYVGVDLSEGMVKAYNTRFNQDATASQKFEAHAVVGNLLEEQPPAHLSTPEFFNFDLAVVGMGFHHLADVQLAATRLAERLKPGGVLMIIDLVAYETDEKIEHISHHGFSEATVRTLFGNAGLDDINIMVFDEEWQIKDQKRRAFMARGKKPASSNL